MSTDVTPEALVAGFVKVAIAAHRSLVPVVEAIMPDPIILHIDIEIRAPPFSPSMTPPAASLIIAVTISATKRS